MPPPDEAASGVERGAAAPPSSTDETARGGVRARVEHARHGVEGAKRKGEPLGVAVGLLVWLYVIGRLAVAAPVLNATLHAHRREHDVPGPDD